MGDDTEIRRERNETINISKGERRSREPGTTKIGNLAVGIPVGIDGTA